MFVFMDFISICFGYFLGVNYSRMECWGSSQTPHTKKREELSFFSFSTPSGARLRYLLLRSRVLDFYIPPKSPFGKGGLSQGSSFPRNTKKSEKLSFLASVPLDVLFSNELLTDLARIWALRYIIEDPEIVECKHFIRMA